MKLLWVFGVFVFVMCKWVNGFLELDELNVTEVSYVEEGYHGDTVQLLMVGLTLIPGAVAKGAVCLDGTPPGYHIHHGYGSGANSWLIQLEGGGWCNTVRNCVYRKTSRRGSSKFMEKQIPFVGILSNKAEENPDFFNWNRVKLRYCDGASFSGDSYHEIGRNGGDLQFRGNRIWLAGMEELMHKGMHSAKQALLSGCSAGGLASILHCDEFAEMFPRTTKVKCLSDAGLFLDAFDVSGGHTLRNMYGGIVSLQQLAKNLPRTCTNHLDPTSCFFPQNLIASIKTPMFILNAAYDAWQLQASLAPPSAILMVTGMIVKKIMQDILQHRSNFCKISGCKCSRPSKTSLCPNKMAYLSTHALLIARVRDRIHGFPTMLLSLKTRELH